MNNKTLSLILLLSLGMIWGTGYSIARFVTTSGVAATSYSFWQSLGPAILLGCISFLITKKNKFKSKRIVKQRKLSSIRFYFITGLTGIAIPNTCMYLAASHLPAGILAVIVNTVPLFAFPLALATKIEKFSLTRFAGILLAVSGLLFIILHKISFNMVAANNAWFFIALITPFSFAVCTIYITHARPDDTNPIKLAAGMLGVASILLIPLIALTGGLYIPKSIYSLTDISIIAEIILSSLGYIIFFELLRIAGPVYYSLVDTTVSLTGLAWGYILFNEKINLATAGGVLCISIGVLIVTRLQSQIKSTNKVSSKKLSVVSAS